MCAKNQDPKLFIRARLVKSVQYCFLSLVNCRYNKYILGIKEISIHAPSNFQGNNFYFMLL